MGTPQAAVPTLRRCLHDGHEVVAVWTQPDKPAGRGNKVAFSPVKEFALSHGLSVFQPTRIKNDEAKQLFASHDADVAVVVAYGRILPEEFLRAPRRGCINVHFSLLPLYRGAAPANWAIVNGETEFTGSNQDKANAAIDKALNTLPKISLSILPDSILSDTLYFRYESSTADKNFFLHVALFENNLTSKIGKGENSGKTLTHTHVVRIFYTVELNVKTGDAKIPLRGLALNKNCGLVAFVQHKQSMKILGAASATHLPVN